MKISNLTSNNLKSISTEIPANNSIGIGGLSGSGKSTFCTEVYNESVRKIVTLLPKSEYRFLFPEQIQSNCYASGITELPLVFYLRKISGSSNPRSTLGTHSGIFKKIRMLYAKKFKKPNEFFSFNNSFIWCEKCKGRGSTAGVECKECFGDRYSDEVNKYKIEIKNKEYSIVDINKLNIKEIRYLAPELNLDDTDIRKLDNMINLGMPYLSLNRVMGTLSGGETIRVLLSEFMACCSGALLILDEVSTGLDKNSLLNVLGEINKLGGENQIWFIDHSDTVLNAAEKNIYFGPGSGADGGNIVEVSPRPKPIYPEHNFEIAKDYYFYKNLRKRNIEIESLKIPKNKITAITGESGCGKSTLVHDCIIPYMKQHNKKVNIILIDQDKNQSITSRSTIASFLGIKNDIKKMDDNFLSRTIEEVLDNVKVSKSWKSYLSILYDLGLGYLELDRKIQTLSGGEFQGVHLVSKLQDFANRETLIIMDEPSKGLSQNILNKLMKRIRDIQKEYNVTFLIIEHNEYIIKASDYVLDFGKRTEQYVKKLDVTTVKEWENSVQKNLLYNKDTKVVASRENIGFGIEHIEKNVDKIYDQYENCFKGGMLKSYSQTAQWIYKDFNAVKISPVITIDFEKMLYSSNTFLFEIASIINDIVKITHMENSYLKKFDYYNMDNICKYCKGTGHIDIFDINVVIDDPNAGLWSGLLKESVMRELKKYNYSKIKFLFTSIKKATGLDLNKEYKNMTEAERRVFLHGYWKETFYDSSKKTQRRWYGILHLIEKYMRSSKSPLKEEIKKSKALNICPICNGFLLNHEDQLNVRGHDIRDILSLSIQNITDDIVEIPKLLTLAKYIDGNIKLNQDVSKLSCEQQVILKCFELYCNKYSGFYIVLKNLKPYYNIVKGLIDVIAVNNKVIMLDWDDIDKTTEELLLELDLYKKKASQMYMHEILGYKKVSRDINAVRRQYPCEYCLGKKVIQEKDIVEGIDTIETTCEACCKTGISNTGMDVIVQEHKVKDWVLGTVGDICLDVPKEIQTIPVYMKVRDLNKHQILSLYRWMVKKDVNI